MATVITKELNITIDNSPTYCTAVNCDLAEETYAFRKYLNGSTDGYATLNDAAKELLFPSNTAHPFKADSAISCSRSGGTCTVALQFGGGGHPAAAGCTIEAPLEAAKARLLAAVEKVV